LELYSAYKPKKPYDMKTMTERKSEVINELFRHQLQDIYWAETEIDKFMPKIVREVTSDDLRSALEEHMKITKGQIKRLESVFGLLGSEVKGEKCDGMQGLIDEAEKIIDEAQQGMVRDAFIIGAVQKVEHYEMASYGTLKAIASIIGEFEVASLLGETLEEEKEADMKLTEIAENLVNIEAASESGELEEEEDFEESDEAEDLDMDEEEEDEEEYEIGARGRSKSRR
jgi:ferritin-like metal-binding protein YciE